MAEHASGGAVLQAVASVDIDRLPALREAGVAAGTLGGQAARIEVTDAISAQTATALLGQVVAARRHAEAQRLDLTRPLAAVVKKINAAATRTQEPLKHIEAGLKAKLLVYQREQERLAAVERERLEAEAQRRRDEEAAERRKAEEAARVEREASARAAAAAEAAERQARADAERREREETDALSAKVRAATDPQLRALVDRGSPQLRGMAKAELANRAELLAAQDRIAAARAREDLARAAEESARLAPALPIAAPAAVAVAPLAGGGAKVSTRKRWTFEVDDFERVPDRFKELARGEVQAAIRSGERSIPGVRVFQVDDASVTV